MMASLRGDVKPLVLSHSSFFHQSRLKGRLKNPNTVRKEWGTFLGGRAITGGGGGWGLQKAHKWKWTDAAASGAFDTEVRAYC